MNSHLNDEAKRSIDHNYNLLVTNEVGRLPEYIFRDYFLPFFCGELSFIGTNVLVDWISVAGSPSKEVAILDNADQELFRVPALMDTNAIDTVSKRDGLSITDIFINYEMQNGILPILGATYLRKAMDSKIDTIIKSSPSYESNLNRWKEIFKRYNKNIDKEKDNDPNNKILSNTDDDLEW